MEILCFLVFHSVVLLKRLHGTQCSTSTCIWVYLSQLHNLVFPRDEAQVNRTKGCHCNTNLIWGGCYTFVYVRQNEADASRETSFCFCFRRDCASLIRKQLHRLVGTHPPWLKVRPPGGERYTRIKAIAVQLPGGGGLVELGGRDRGRAREDKGTEGDRQGTWYTSLETNNY